MSPRLSISLSRELSRLDTPRLDFPWKVGRMQRRSVGVDNIIHARSITTEDQLQGHRDGCPRLRPRYGQGRIPREELLSNEEAQRIKIWRSTARDLYAWSPGQALFVCITCHIYCIISMKVIRRESISHPHTGLESPNIDTSLQEAVQEIIQLKAR